MNRDRFHGEKLDGEHLHGENAYSDQAEGGAFEGSGATRFVVNEQQVRAAVRAWHHDLGASASGATIDLWPGIATELHAIDRELASERVQTIPVNDSDRHSSRWQRPRSGTPRIRLERIVDALLPRFALGGLVTAFVGVLALLSLFSRDGSTPVFEHRPFEQGLMQQRVAMHRVAADRLAADGEERQSGSANGEHQEFIRLRGEVEGSIVHYQEPLILRVDFDPNYLARGDEEEGEHLTDWGAEDPIASSQLRLPLPSGRAFVRRALRSERASRGTLWQVAERTRPVAFQGGDAHTRPFRDELR